MKPEEAQIHIARGEGQNTEFKTSFAEENEAIETLCAFANAEGGTVYLGVKNNGDIIGVSIGQNTLENFANKLCRDTNPPLTPSIQQLELKSYTIVSATVEPPSQGQLFYAFNHCCPR